MRVMVTGASGFVGRHVLRRFHELGVEAVATGRRPQVSLSAEPSGVVLTPATAQGELCEKMAGFDAVVHLAGVVHDRNNLTSVERISEVNEAWTSRLALAAVSAGVPRFLFSSTVKVVGEQTAPSQAFDEASPAAPHGPYAESKWAAERSLTAISNRTGLAVTIVRPPLVYGPGVRANFFDLMLAVQRGLPLPFGGIHNKRSLVFVGNLADALVQATLAPTIGTKTFFVSDSEDVSTPELVRKMAKALGTRPRLLPIPGSWILLGSRMLGRSALAERLVGSLCVDSSLIRREVGWRPRFSLDEGLVQTATWLATATRSEQHP